MIKHLWEYGPLGQEPMDVNSECYIYESFNEFLRCQGSDPWGYVMLFWEWKPSYLKAKQQNLTHIIDHIVTEEEPMYQGETGHPCDDKTCHNYYRDYDTLNIMMTKIINGHFEKNMKIVVTDQDEEAVREYIYKMKKYVNDYIYQI